MMFVKIIFIFALAVFVLFVAKHEILMKKYNSLRKYLFGYLNIITSARYGNLNLKCEEGFDDLTNQLSKNTNALIESIYDRDAMINEHIEKEKQSQNLKQDFISGLAHDFKVPIVAQDNTYDLLLSGHFGELSEVQKAAVKNLKISNNDLKNLVVDMLDAHKLEAKQFELNLEEVDVNKLILEVLEQNKSVLEYRNKEVIFNSQDKIISLLDSFLIKRALNNLISNAIYYGKNSKNIEIALKKNGKHFEISVIDEGDGIKEDINSIFKKYYSASKKYSNVGVGLGLYIVNQIALAHKGSVSAKNLENRGACFTIKLPC